MADDTECRQIVHRLLPGSREKARQLAALARSCRFVWNTMLDQQEQLVAAAKLAGGTVVVEDLNTRGTTRSAKGTVEEPGTGVRRKAGYNRAILATGWSGLRAMLAHKAPRLIAVNLGTCAECGTAGAASRPSQATFTCVACGHADLNAARNIRRRGQAHLHGEGASPSGTPMIRETDRRLAA